MTDTGDTNMSQMRHELHVLEQSCEGLDCETLFFGPKKHIQDLQLIISHQKQYIQLLERKLRTLGVQLELHHGRREATVQTHTANGRVIGSVLGHETHVVHSLQQQLQHRHVALNLQDSQADEPASITLLFHRKKARLPQDEIKALLDKALHQGAPGHIIVIFMHNIASGHERSQFKAVGPNNTDSGCWSAFAQQCHLITDMTFDESKIEWNEINKHALHLIVEAVNGTATQETGSHDQHNQSATQQRQFTSEPPSPSHHGPRPSTHTCGHQ